MRATAEGTARFAARQPVQRQGSYRQTTDGLHLASLGLGTYLGEADDATDAACIAAFGAAVEGGCNLFDLAINYRYQRSERAFGRWLATALAAGQVARDEVVVCTKGGFVPYDGAPPDDPKAWVARHLLDHGLGAPHEYAARYQHCLAPTFLEQMIAWSLRNLGLETIDIYYLHNPETQSIALSAETFRNRLLDAFETLELAVERGQIAAYGLATWTAFRALPDAPDYLSLTEMVGLAAEVAGQNHHLKYVQLPYNLFMTEAFAFENQQVGEAFLSAIAAAEALGLTVLTSAPLLQGRLVGAEVPALAATMPALPTTAQRALQFARSTPGVAAALVGMKDLAHVAENLAVLDASPTPGEVIRSLYGGEGEA
jgi:aryl-alcohol dehydrogenase-like predicted oxidoreductase